MKKFFLAVSAVATIAVGTYFSTSEASDHDDGDNDIKSRALNLTDHFAFKSPTAPNELSLIMYFNPRSLPGKQYFLSTNARYEFHVSKAASRTSAPTLADDFVFRFEGKAPDAAGVQDITLTVLKNGTVAGTVTGKSTDFATSKANTNVTVNTGSAGGVDVKFFVGMRADSFYFDVNRFFQVRNFLARRFFGGAGGNGLPIDPVPTNTSTTSVRLSPNCEGDLFLQGVVAADGDGDDINLFNPPSCAPDFTKNLNITAIVLNVPIAQLEGKIFDTWSTISVKQ
jgi:hypothetical protein